MTLAYCYSRDHLAPEIGFDDVYEPHSVDQINFIVKCFRPWGTFQRKGKKFCLVLR